MSNFSQILVCARCSRSYSRGDSCELCDQCPGCCLHRPPPDGIACQACGRGDGWVKTEWLYGLWKTEPLCLGCFSGMRDLAMRILNVDRSTREAIA
jgi:hypothetical protein